MPDDPDPIAAFLAGYPPAVRAVAERLRQVVAGARPGAIETLHARHNHFSYSLSGKLREEVLYICPLPTYVRLGFFYGGTLSDPDRRLVGEDKRLRHIKIATLAQADDPAVARLVRAAWDEVPRFPGGVRSRL
jgi:hypothetical protein